MPPIKGQMFRYSEADMEAAIRECRRGVATSTAAKKFGVPRVTLLNKVKGKTPIKRKMGRACYISDDTEALLVNWAKALVKRGFPIGKENLQDSVKKIVDDLNLETPFKNGRPGKRWYNSFLKRHPELIPRQPQNLTSSRAAVTTSQLKNWYKEVSMYLQENNHTNILAEPHRIFNMDETAFFFNPKGNKVLAPKGEKSVYQQVNSDEKECFTVLLGGNAAGQVLPPMVIFKYLRIPRELSLSVPATWGIGRSDSGWMTMETFYEYICNIFDKWLNDNGIQKPVILFMDGHTSHMSFHLSKFCSENGIILIALYPNATHLLQPMDVAIFRSLKGAWRTAVKSWRLENIDAPTLRKVHFCPLLNQVLTETLTPEMFINGFRKCGLSPWNPNEVCSAPEQPTDEFMAIQKMAKIKELEMGLKFLDKYIASEKIEENIGLFQFYKKIEDLLTKTKEDVLPPTENISTLNNTTSEQGSRTPCQAVPSSDPLTMPSTSQAVNLDFQFQYLSPNEDPKTPCKEVQESTTQNLEGTINTGSLIEPPTSSHYNIH
ncbi:tigger transposable element-derived protein 1-like [Spodoptera litura]|uniref:Tigger transposable element-derived protein 1-like n=1 Tax=Spodoptera litura TaxID=69820 RepID=A0A9J7J3K0_SPOLT|nr:tigger transposable element-derived protein 1-like [Spodoptera litura]